MRKGILLINLGTPDSASVADVRKYLTEFLNDSRVIDISPLGRFLLVNGLIVPFRAAKSAAMYQKIITNEGSPLLIYGNEVKQKLQHALGENYVVELGMRYQKPSILSALEKLREARVNEITVFPMYPQYASSSTGSSIEKVLKILKNWEVKPSLKIISKFYDHPDFINAWAEVSKKYFLNDYDYFLFSYHGLPERHIKKAAAHYGNNACLTDHCCDKINADNAYCYRAACYETTRQLVKKLQIPEGKFSTSFQSRLNDKWLKPYSDKVIEEKAKQGIKKMLVFSPAFVADCLETLYEIGTEYDALFRKHGGEKIQLVESLNSHPAWISALKKIVE